MKMECDITEYLIQKIFPDLQGPLLPKFEARWWIVDVKKPTAG